MVLTAKEHGWPAVIEAVEARDGGCIFRPTGRSQQLAWGICGGPIEHDHVKEQPKIGDPIKKRADKHSYKAPDDEAHLVCVCARHHRHTSTATSHQGRAYERGYLAAFYPDIWGLEDADA